MTTLRQEPDGSWVLAIPLPYMYLLNVRCECGRRFIGRRRRARVRYEKHYLQFHQGVKK